MIRRLVDRHPDTLLAVIAMLLLGDGLRAEFELVMAAAHGQSIAIAHATSAAAYFFVALSAERLSMLFKPLKP